MLRVFPLLAMQLITTPSYSQYTTKSWEAYPNLIYACQCFGHSLPTDKPDVLHCSTNNPEPEDEVDCTVTDVVSGVTQIMSNCFKGVLIIFK